MLRQGGSAADAAFATLLALNVVEPQSSGIGGGGYLVYADARRRAGHLSTAARPRRLAATALVLQGRPADAVRRGAVPGGQERRRARQHPADGAGAPRHGKLPWAALFQPAIRLARDGFAITPRLHNIARHGYAATGALSAAGAGAVLCGPTASRCRSARSCATRRSRPCSSSSRGAGPDSFYVGPNAQAIAAAVSGAPHNPSPMTAGDIASYEAKPRPAGVRHVPRLSHLRDGPVRRRAATTVFAILKQLERFDLSRARRRTRRPPGT